MNVMQFLNVSTKYSLPRWNRNPVLRRAFRRLAQTVIRRRIDRDENLQYLIQTTRLQDGVNLYPAPYSTRQDKVTGEYAFAPWPEEDDALVGDCFGNFVIRRSPSYCAALIYFATGKILSERPADGNAHAKNWVKLLAINGFDQKAKRPIDGSYYIGVTPNIGEFGQLYWFEHTETSNKKGLRYRCSTYENFEYQQVLIRADRKDITWVKIA